MHFPYLTLLLYAALLALPFGSRAQGVSIGTNTAPHPSAVLDVTSTAAGFAMPGMTTAQRRAIASPKAGLQVYDVDLQDFYFFNGTRWDCVSSRAGTVQYFANATPPGGYLACNGQLVSRTQYPELFAALGTLYGAGDGTTTFALPDLRGEFLRGWSNGSTTADAGRALGSLQGDQLRFHTHNVPVRLVSTNPISISGPVPLVLGNFSYANSTMTTDATGAGETRPRNVALLVCIKY